MTERKWAGWLERLYGLRRDKSGSHERPHKSILLLSIIDLLDRGAFSRNKIPLSEELVATFKRYFEAVRRHGRTGVEHFPVGSRAERVVRDAHCPVFMVRPTWQNKAGRKRKKD